MTVRKQRINFAEPALQAELAKLREVNNYTNLGWLAMEWVTIVVASGLAILFSESRAAWGLAWGWNIPVFAIAVAILGGVQHRLAGLGHEASHYSFLKNKLANDLVADLFCMMPIMTNVHFYRLFHMAHHQYVNDPALDPDLVNLGKGKRVDQFPMTRNEFIAKVYFVMVTAPVAFFRYGMSYVHVNVFGKGGNVYMKRVPNGDAHYAVPRLGTMLGIAYFLGFVALQAMLLKSGRAHWLVQAWVIGLVLAAGVIWKLPKWATFQSPFRQPYSERLGGLIRLGFFTGIIVAQGLFKAYVNPLSGLYFNLLWNLPLATSFTFYMLLRDTYQHTNADDDRITNTRVFFSDPFTRWAVFVYSQDMHVPHHLFPAVPHYRLHRLHNALKRRHPEYAANVIECHGTFANDSGHPTILDEMTKGRD
jgi:fatty acid desaturase